MRARIHGLADINFGTRAEKHHIRFDRFYGTPLHLGGATVVDMNITPLKSLAVLEPEEVGRPELTIEGCLDARGSLLCSPFSSLLLPKQHATSRKPLQGKAKRSNRPPGLHRGYRPPTSRMTPAFPAGATGRRRICGIWTGHFSGRDSQPSARSTPRIAGSLRGLRGGHRRFAPARFGRGLPDA